MNMLIRKGEQTGMYELIFKMISQLWFFFLRVGPSYNFPPPLPDSEEKLCFEKMKKGDKAARARLIEHNMRLVAHIVKKYYVNSPDRDDLISIGTIGLIKAIDTFEPASGTRFATYAGKCMQNEILMYFRRKRRICCETSIEDAVDVDKDGNPLTYLDILSTDGDIADEIDAKLKSQQTARAINSVLLERERQIIILRYGLTETGRIHTQREVAQLLGISRSYVSRIEKSALQKLRKALGG